MFCFVVGIVAVAMYRGHSRCVAEQQQRARAALVRTLEARHHDRLVSLASEPAEGRESVEGLPVPIVPGTRVDEARVETPLRTPNSDELPGWNRGPRSTPDLPPGTVLVKGQLSATEERALADARSKLRRKLTEWLVPDVPASWKVPDPLINQAIRDRQVKPVEKDYGTVFEATLRVEMTPELRAQIVETYRRELVAQRLAILSGVIGFILACLAALAGYIRADEATKGYYTNWLRAVAAAGVGASGVVIYQMLT